MRGEKLAPSLCHRCPAVRIGKQFADRFDGAIRIVDAARGAAAGRNPRDLGEVEGRRPDHHRRSDRQRLDQVLPAERQQRAADECDVRRGVVREHLAHAVAEHDRRVCLHRRVAAATDIADPGFVEQPRDFIESLRMPRHEDEERSVRQRGTAHRLEELVSFAREDDQTVTYFGWEGGELADLARRLGERGLDRLVPVGDALAFDTLWDGYDLLDDFTRRVRVR